MGVRHFHCLFIILCTCFLANIFRVFLHPLKIFIWPFFAFLDLIPQFKESVRRRRRPMVTSFLRCRWPSVIFLHQTLVKFFSLLAKSWPTLLCCAPFWHTSPVLPTHISRILTFTTFFRFMSTFSPKNALKRVTVAYRKIYSFSEPDDRQALVSNYPKKTNNTQILDDQFLHT
jgi:hypothetical protein